MRALMLAAVLALLPAATTATEYSEFAEGFTTVGDVWGDPQSPGAYQEAAARVVPVLLDALLGVEPEPCYEDAYVAWWRAYATMYHLAATEPTADEWEAIAALAGSDVQDAAAAFTAAIC